MRQRQILAAVFVALLSITLRADHKAFLGRWNLTGTPPNSDDTRLPQPSAISSRFG